MSEQKDCPTCNGCGEVVKTVSWLDPSGEVKTDSRAESCSTCGGTGKVPA